MKQFDFNKNLSDRIQHLRSKGKPRSRASQERPRPTTRSRCGAEKLVAVLWHLVLWFSVFVVCLDPCGFTS